MEKKFGNLLSLNSLFKPSSGGENKRPHADPQIGFRVALNERQKQLKVRVIGARQLPTEYGSVKAKGYCVKVTVFPNKEKYETKVVKDSWPSINEDFSFDVNIPEKRACDPLKGKFVSFTIYSVFEDAADDDAPTEKAKPRNVMKRFFSFNDESDFIRKSGRFHRRSLRNSLMRDRKTIGAVTYNLELKNFTQVLRQDLISTADVWRSIKEITSGIPSQPREGRKGCVELTLQYAVSEDGANDVIEITVTKFRCSLQTMQDHEKIGGQLYIKITAFESEDVVQKKKSDMFDPTISLKLEANTATLRARVNSFMLSHVKIVIRLLAKNILGKKTLLGRIEIDKNNPFWKEIIGKPGMAVTKLVNFE
ncbi:uncharacterized protein LOC132696640 [Cylas formicarius]|uniref:uncharacterized protein LOC132696537 n=1 Tax=Cylas formicarius TaxID=197179 RepID=UPI00295848FE|nr:uncharacterized protein LOC132696537 [Cylas formicarius]XP_060517572.1 uncharacterized protein LOC132696640 [Cylas formicarius]